MIRRKNLAALLVVGTGACVGSFAYQLTSPATERAHKSVQVTLATNSKNPSPTRSSQSPESSFRELQKCLDRAEAAAAKLAGYTAVLDKQEEVNEDLQDPDSIDIKIRHKPFSVYMRWHDDGQEALFVEGQNDGKLLAKPKKGLAAMKVWRLDPESKQARKNCRHPITTLGIENLAQRVIQFYHSRKDWDSAVKCRASEITLNGTQVLAYEVRFANHDVSTDYCHSRYFFEKQTGLLVGLENYRWPSKEDQETEPALIEKYHYRNLNLKAQLSDNDFAEDNPKYAFSD